MAAGSFATGFQPGWLTFDVTVEPWTGQYNDYGQPLYGAGATYKCFIQDRVQMIRDPSGNEKTATTTLYICGGPFDVHDRFTLSASFRGPSQPPVLNISNVNDRNGFDHSEVYL